ncbi:unnamed protein product [Cuscuta campestris]|uniref:Replication factor A C-terminal domain-containing protein n=1 Tax=Cuscuta campestris TaxID=132261 RepID=A0A484N6L7_9ASTE|nr:unnamed protein product [Cuscuta campestris]
MYLVEDDFLRCTCTTTIEALKDYTENGNYAVYGTIKGVDGGSDWFITACQCGSEVIPRSGSYYCSDCKKRVLNVIPRPGSMMTTCFNEFDPTYNVIDVCFNEQIIAKFKDMNSPFFSPQADIAPRFSTGEKEKTHGFLEGDTSSCVKDLVADFVETVDSRSLQAEDDMNNLTPLKRMQEKEAMTMSQSTR